MENELKYEFEKWLIDHDYKGQTPKKYVSALNSLNYKLPEIFNNRNFFDFDYDEFPELLSKIENVPNYKELNRKNNGTLNASIVQFKRLLTYLVYDNNCYFSIKIFDPNSIKTVNKIENCEKNIEIDRLTQHWKKLRWDN